jgi:U3 small nucleolar RNA-associated protein 23
MRLKKVRNARRRLSFYRATYGFQPPFSVLVDGTAVQTSINLKVSLADEVPKVLGGRAQLLVHPVVLNELKALGSQFAAAERLARSLPALPSVTASAGAAAEVLLDLVANGNQERYCILTEDPALQRLISKLPGVPLLRFARERVIVEAPVERTARGAEAAKQLEEANSKPVPAASAPATARPAMSKAKKRKEPNPLSCKRKKIKKVSIGGRGGGGGEGAGAEEAASEGSRRKRKRAR